jgi:aminomethyltransferase
MFDVSHMARLEFRGDRVLEFLEWITTNDVAKLSDGNGQYSILPNAAGGAVDDIIVYRGHDTFFRMVVNASNHAKDVAHITALNTFGVEITDLTAETAMIAVQGPRAVEIVAGLSPQGTTLQALPFFGTAEAEVAGIPCFAARSGYTGEDGFELVCPAAGAVALWQALQSAGVMPCGLGSRDVLRVEAGLPLYGHELTDELSPLAASLGWVVSKTKTFVGSEHYQAARANGTPTKLQGIRMNGRRIPAVGADVLVEGVSVGQVSSGVFSPTLGCGIAFAFLDPAVKAGTPITIDFRGQAEAGTVVNKRFLKPS